MPDRLRLRIWRTVGNGRTRPGFQVADIEVERTAETVLDAIERVWSTIDPSLVFRHACHHASCGTCAVRVNGRERLPCITSLAEVWDGHATLTIEPLRNVAAIADLAVDPTEQIDQMAALRFPYVRAVEADVRCAAADAVARADGDIGTAERFEDCLECLACVSACPVAAGSPEYLGPAVLAAAQRVIEEPRHGDVDDVLGMVDSEHGIWQCRSAWACSAVCPSGVDPARRIMELRRRVIMGASPTIGDPGRSVPAGVGR